MKIPVSWLKEFVDVQVEPRRLGEDLTAVGLALEGLLGDGDEAVLDLDVTTNRVDCMNVYGVAREVSVLYGVPLKPPPVDLEESGEPAAQALEVRIEASDLCPRFCARVLDVRLAPSPPWLGERLEKAGVRPINNVVDLTNYVMLELGHPSHAFDLAKVPGAVLVARWGREGERITTLDSVERAVPASPRVGLVASSEGPLAIAGVMGGASSEVGGETRVVALEAAYWDPLSIRRAAKALAMHTEASHRFERGADPEAAPLATARIAHLLQKIGAGTARPGLIDCFPSKRATRSAPLRHARVALVLGTSVPEDRAGRILAGLGFDSRPVAEGLREVVIPTWRGDVAREIDLIEEVGRHHGLDRVPSTLPQGIGAVGLRPWQLRERLLRGVLVAAGFDEVITLTFPPEPPIGDGATRRIRLANPLAEDQAALRHSLVEPGLIASLMTNIRQGRRDAQLFEIGRVFLPAESLAKEERRLGFLLAGQVRAPHWTERKRAADFWDLKGLLTSLTERLGLPPAELARDGVPPLLHPGKSACVRWGGDLIGFIGAVHPDLQERAGLSGEVYVGELCLERWLQTVPEAVRFQPITRHPAVLRDVSLVCEAATEAASLAKLAQDAGGALLRSVTVADRYEGPPVPAGRVSLLLALLFQDPSRTLTSEEVDAGVAAIQSALRAAGVEIRGE